MDLRDASASKKTESCIVGWTAEGALVGKQIIQPISNPSGVPRRGCSSFFCSNTLPSFATGTYKKVAQGFLFVRFYTNYLSKKSNTTPVNSPRVPRRGCSNRFCFNTLPPFATDTYKLVALGSLFIWVYSDYLSFSVQISEFTGEQFWAFQPYI